MSAAVRNAVAAAMNTVEGINCTPYFRQTTKAGEAMVRLDRKNRDSSGFGFMAVWQVIVVLPQDIASAEKYLDEKAESLVSAASEELVVTSLTPQQLALDTGAVPCVVIEGTRGE